MKLQAKWDGFMGWLLIFVGALTITTSIFKHWSVFCMLLEILWVLSGPFCIWLGYEIRSKITTGEQGG